MSARPSLFTDRSWRQAWLIERTVNVWPEWWIAGKREGFGAIDTGTWTRDAYAATWFDTKEEAERPILLFNLRDAKAIEHGFEMGGTDASDS